MKTNKKKYKKNNRKAIIFSILSLMILLSLFMITAEYQKNSKQKKEELVSYGTAQKMNYIFGNIGTDIANMLGFKPVIMREGNITAINFTDYITLSKGNDYTARMQTIRNYYNNTYGRFTNTNISMTSQDSRLLMLPFGITIDTSGENLTFIEGDWSKLTKIEIELLAYELKNTTYDFPSSAGSSYPNITIKIQRDDGVYVFNQSKNLDINSLNKPFYMLFNTSLGMGNLSVTFGTAIGVTGLKLQSKDLATKIKKLEMTFNDGRTIEVRSYMNATVIPLGTNYEKNSYIVVVRR